MNVRIFWVHAMKCMCAQTRPRFILSSERVLGAMEFELMLTPREKSPLPENFPRGGSNPRRCGQRAQTLPTSYSGPQHQDESCFNTHIKFHPDPLKSVGENKTNSFCSALTLWPSAMVKVTERGVKWQTSMVLVGMAGVKQFGWKVFI